MNRLFILIVFLFLSGCLGSRNTTCKHYFESCNKKAQLPDCEKLNYSDTEFTFPTKDLIGVIDSAEVRKFMEYDSFYNQFLEESKGAESLWYYDNSGKHGGMYVGTEGVIALKGCTILSSFPIIIYN